MPWVRKFRQPIALKDGRTIATLADARRVVLSLPRSEQSSPGWQDADNLLARAASRDGSFVLEQVQAQFPKVLRASGLI